LKRGGLAKATPGVARQRRLEGRSVPLVAPDEGSSAARTRGPLKPGPESLGQQVVGLAGGEPVGSLPASVKARRMEKSGTAS